ncbi:hypothetical protein SAMN03159444_00220 [Pseudomonas sp. NFACC02]|jgi:hypothetical protein|uniref:hypothetical protein n=1 Tax=Pseudomonas TaxID=286 RepID=UPI00078505F9|nr:MULTISPECIES: hypothetical protein [Pseudomonas]SEP61717.1 hypothetical protein SAMN03159444_00220 [Pseudomonas sp. NFACC02]
MGSIHEQAMNYVYQQVLQRLLSYFNRAERTALQLLIQRLIVAAGGMENIGTYKVLVAFSGGKDSAYTVALMRAAQLSIAGRAPATFQLRVANMRHAGMTSAVMANIHRCYSALFLHDDPRVELLVVDHQYVQTFEPDLPFSSAGREQNRSDMLLGGHLTAGDARTTFCNSCYLGMAEFLGRAACWGEGVDAVISGDSLKEQKQYATWIMRLARHEGQAIENWHKLGFMTALNTIDSVGRAYYRELYGEEAQPAGFMLRPLGYPNKPVAPAFLTVADLIGFRLEEHWALLTDFLGFRFDDLAFSFSESDCANPLLMAHMRGLKAQFVQGRAYADGVAEYLELAAEMMRRKRMPKRLITQALAAYDRPDKLEERRALAAGYAQEALGLSETQLVCLLFAPFVDAGAQLEAFLRICHPGMLVALADLHRALSGLSAPDQVIQWLVDVSGLSLKGLQNLYEKRRVDFTDDSSIIARVRASDPDKGHVTTVDLQTGEAVTELISGR